MSDEVRARLAGVLVLVMLTAGTYALLRALPTLELHAVIARDRARRRLDALRAQRSAYKHAQFEAYYEQRARESPPAL